MQQYRSHSQREELGGNLVVERRQYANRTSIYLQLTYITSGTNINAPLSADYYITSSAAHYFCLKLALGT